MIATVEIRAYGREMRIEGKIVALDTNENLKIMDNTKNSDDGHEKLDEEDVDNGPNKTKVKPKVRKW